METNRSGNKVSPQASTKEIQWLTVKVKRDFTIAMCLMGVIPFLVFSYLLFARLSIPMFLSKEVTHIVVATVVVAGLGLMVARKMRQIIIQHLCAYHQKVSDLQAELVEKNRLAAITETTLALSHEINNPLLMAIGNLELIDEACKREPVSDEFKQRLEKVRDQCLRIREATAKLANLTQPVARTVWKDSKMIDLTQSK